MSATTFDKSSLTTYMKQAANHRILSRKELCQVIEDSEAPRDDIIRNNLRLVISIAKRYMNRGLALEDLIQEGNLGLIRAAEGYDPSLGTCFSTYATWWIRQSVERAIINKRRTIRIPIEKDRMIKKIIRAREQHISETGEIPSISQLAQILQIPEEKVEKILRLASGALSLDGVFGNYSNPLMESISDDVQTNPNNLWKDYLRKSSLRRALTDLTERQQQVLMLRFGFLDGERHSLATVGKKLGFSTETIRQVELRALTALRQHHSDLLRLLV